jgi:predicted permease
VKFPWRNREQKLKDELQNHLQMATLDRVDRGQSPEEAGYAARREFGNVSLVGEVTRDQWHWRGLDEVLQDLRYAARMLRKNPGFALVAVLTLALGIGANTALFSVVNGVLLNPLPYPHPEELVTLHESKPNFEHGSISYPNFRDWQKYSHSFSAMAISRGYGFSFTGLGEAEQLSGRFISSDFFSILGVKPVLGRTFTPGEDEIGAAPLALISAGLWDRKFSARADVLDKGITLDGRTYTIVGVIPADFDKQFRGFIGTEIYAPLGQWNNPLLPQRGAGLGLHGIARLKPGVTIEQARADMREVTHNLAVAYPNDDTGIGAAVIPLKQDTVGDVQPFLLVLLAAVGLVLLIACVNVANLLLARSTARAREFAIRGALGASHGRVVRQVLAESLLLALIGGGLGLLLANWGTQAALHRLPTTLPRAAAVGVDSRVLVFTAGVTVLAGLLFGLVPALKTSRVDLQNTLKEGGRSLSGTRQRAQSVFVVLEMAMSLVLLIGAGLMLRTLTHLWSVDPGFRPENVLTVGFSMSPEMTKASPEAIRAAMRDLHEKFSSAPGVQAVSVSLGAVPLSGNDDEQLFWLEGQPTPASEAEMNWTLDYIVEPEYLQVMGIPLKRGRFFTWHDDEHSPTVVVIDEVFAKKFFGDQDPIGKRIILNNARSIRVRGADTGAAEIIGVVGHVNQWGLDSDASHSLRAEIYLHCVQMPDAFIAMVPNGLSYMVRGKQATAGLLESLRRTSRQMSENQVLYGAKTMSSIVSDSLAARQFSMILLGVFAGFALLLSSIGIYGVISYLVGQRTQEIGIRIALGARRMDVLRLVLGHGTRMAGLGVLMGMAAALALTRLMATLLYGVSPSDPLTFGGVAVVLGVVALAACYIPARRATQVDPIVALRYE